MDIKRFSRHLRYPAVFCLILLSLAVSGQQAKFTTVVDQTTISRGQVFQVEYVIENAKEVTDFDPPGLRSNFMVLQGPIQSSGTSIINGNMTQYKALVFILQPRSTGKLIVPGATATIDGKRRQSDAVAIEVTKGPAGSNSNSRRPLRFNLPDERVEADREFVLYPNESVSEKIKKNLFVKVEVSKKACYVNEPLIATYKLYSRLRSESRVVKRPSYNGFSVYDMVDPESDNPTIETVNGKQYNVHIIRKSQLFPLQAGNFVLDPVEVENTVRFIRAESEQDTYLEEYHDPAAETVQHTLTISSNPVDIAVKALPALGQPMSFDGAVGKFTVSAALKFPEIKAGEANSLTMAIKGNGNLPMINAPSVEWPTAVEAFDPTAKEDLHPEVAPLSGTKTFEYLFTPKDTGTVVIPPVAFSYFDPRTNSYITDSTRSFSLRVAPGDKKAKAGAAQKRPVIIIPSSQNIWWWVLGGTLVTLLVIGTVILRNRKQAAGRKPAPKPVVAEVVVPVKPDPLEKARRMLSSANATLFVKEVESVVWNEVGETLGIPPVRLNQPQVVSALQKNAADASTIELFKQVMHDCEYALYIPGQSPEDLRSILDKAERFLSKLNTLS